ncbi:MAG TPA: hypothetical protein VF449_03180 [Parvibaculum sp.]
MQPPEGGHNKSAPPAKTGGSREVIFEFAPIGGSVKVTAIDVLTGIEVSVVGPATASSQRELERIAVQKLMHRIERESGAGAPPKTQEPPKGGGTGGGIIV